MDARRDREVCRRIGLGHDRATCECAACAKLRMSHAIDAELATELAAELAAELATLGSDATVLRVLLARRGWTPQRALVALAERARALGALAWRVDRRQVIRWINGEVVPMRLSDRRVIGAEFGVPVAVLLDSAAQHPELCGTSSPDPAAAAGAERVAVPAGGAWGSCAVAAGWGGW